MPKRKRKGVLLPSQVPDSSSTSKGEPGHREEMTSGSTWVQCENTKCLKWRRITAEAAQHLSDKPWYCWLNPDTKFNRCTVEEEKLKKPKHIKFVYSLLPVGEVVMARMSGYPLWPAILTVDQYYGEYYDTLMNKENEVTHYHVEFLGDPHSHAWVAPSGVHPFASVSDQDKIPKFRKLHGKRLMDLKRSFQLALSEAESLVKMDEAERLLRCHFHLKEFLATFEELSVNDSQVQKQDNLKQGKKLLSNALSTIASEDGSSCEKEIGPTLHGTHTHTAHPRVRVKPRKRVHSRKLSTASSSDDGPCERDNNQIPHAVHNKSEPAQQENVKQRKQVLLRTSSILSSSEDGTCESEVENTPRLSISRRSSSAESEDSQHEALDPEERSFMDSLKTCLASKGLSINREPRWRGKRISLFKFYNIVQRHGGCEKVCKGRLWSCIYNELVGADTTQNHGGIGTTARHFYERYLLPFEFHRRKPSSFDAQFVPDGDALAFRLSGKVTATHSSIPVNNEQKVPEQGESPVNQSDHQPDSVNEQRDQMLPSISADFVPSSNPMSPSPYFDYSSDSEVSVEDDCEAAENELVQLERLLSSLEPSLYSPEEPNENSREKQSSKDSTPSHNSRDHPSCSLPNISCFAGNQGGKGNLDVLKTLDEMAKMEGALLEFDSLAGLELEAL